MGSSLKGFRDIVALEGLGQLLDEGEDMDDDSKRTIIFRSLERKDTPPGLLLKRALELFEQRHPATSGGGVVEEHKSCSTSTTVVSGGATPSDQVQQQQGTGESKDGDKEQEKTKGGESGGRQATPRVSSGSGGASSPLPEEGLVTCVEDVKGIVHYVILSLLDFYPELRSSDGIQITIAAVERVVLQQLYPIVFAEVEARVSKQVERLQERYQEAAAVSLGPCGPSPIIKKAVEAMSLLGTTRTGYDKLRCLVTTCERLAEGNKITADELLPMFAETVLRAQPPKLPVELEFIDQFCDRDNLLGAEGYALTTTQAVMSMLLLGPRELQGNAISPPPPPPPDKEVVSTIDNL